MDKLNIEFDWLKEVLPEGIKIPSSTLISGPGGSGKPLIAAMLLTSWLKQGGSIVYYLINSGKDYAEKVFSIYGVNLKDYANQIYFVDFALENDQPVQIAENHVKTNLLKPENWQTTIDQAKNQLDAKNHPTIVFGAALNILLFSPTYGNQIFNYFKDLIKSGENSLFTISNNVFETKMRELEARAENLLFTHSGPNLELHLHIVRMKEVPFKDKDLIVPLTEQELRNMRSEAERMRKHLIPLLKKV